MKIKLFNRDEIFVVTLDKVLYFKAEDHYTTVYYGKEQKQLLPFGLSQVMKAIGCQADREEFIKLGRSILINSYRIVHASVTKEVVTMTNDVGFITLHMSKSLVKELTRKLKGEDSDGGNGNNGASGDCGSDDIAMVAN